MTLFDYYFNMHDEKLWNVYQHIALRRQKVFLIKLWRKVEYCYCVFERKVNYCPFTLRAVERVTLLRFVFGMHPY